MKADVIVVGLGLAGTLLTHELIRSGKSVIVFDDPAQPKASDVAAGIVNPVVFKRLTKSWMLDEAFPVLEKTYRQLEKLAGTPLYFPRKIYRILGKDDLAFWKEKTGSGNLEQFMTTDPPTNEWNQLITAPYGTAVIERAGRLDIPKLTECFSNYLDQNKLLIAGKLEIDELIHSGDQISYKNIIAEKIIFCEGPAAAQNPYFSKLKFKSSKGELIDLHIPDLKLTEILNSNIFILPTGNENYKIGATYSWDLLDWQITDSARTALVAKFRNLFSGDFQIFNQQAGIRPTMHDRKPVIGFLPEFPRIGIFNGLGSKGVLLGPYVAKQFAARISGKTSRIPDEINVRRYF